MTDDQPVIGWCWRCGGLIYEGEKTETFLDQEVHAGEARYRGNKEEAAFGRKS